MSTWRNGMKVKEAGGWDGHCMKSVRIWSFSGPYFPAFGLNTERYGRISPYSPQMRENTTKKIRIRTLFMQWRSGNSLSWKRNQLTSFYMKGTMIVNGFKTFWKIIYFVQSTRPVVVYWQNIKYLRHTS